MEKQRLTKSSGIPKAAARTSCGGRPRAKSRSRNSKSIALAPNRAHQDPPSPKSLPGWTPKAGTHELEAAGVIESKFGPVTLLRFAGDTNSDAAPCLGFLKHLDEPSVRISGWSCQGDDSPARRAAIGCMLNRLTLLTSGNEPKLAELFARAELRRGSCAAAAMPPTSADWVTGAQNPRLRGSL